MILPSIRPGVDLQTRLTAVYLEVACRTPLETRERLDHTMQNSSSSQEAGAHLKGTGARWGSHGSSNWLGYGAPQNRTSLSNAACHTRGQQTCGKHALLLRLLLLLTTLWSRWFGAAQRSARTASFRRDDACYGTSSHHSVDVYRSGRYGRLEAAENSRGVYQRRMAAGEVDTAGWRCTGDGALQSVAGARARRGKAPVDAQWVFAAGSIVQ